MYPISKMIPDMIFGEIPSGSPGERNPVPLHICDNDAQRHLAKTLSLVCRAFH